MTDLHPMPKTTWGMGEHELMAERSPRGCATGSRRTATFRELIAVGRRDLGLHRTRN
jgi:hypothetical protein